MATLIVAITCFLAVVLDVGSACGDEYNILNYASSGSKVDRSGQDDASEALNDSIAAANLMTAKGRPACVYIPSGRYRITRNPPQFERAGCIHGDGSNQSTLVLDRNFRGDLFTWSESWAPTTPGPTVVGIRILGDIHANSIQNAFVFYDRNDQVFLDDIAVDNLHGSALLSGIAKHADQAYMRESHMRSLRFFRDGAPSAPVVEFRSEGSGISDATNEIRLSQVDIYGSAGPSFVIRNNGSSSIRDITIDSLRIEGLENGTTAADLMTIGDPVMKGNVNSIMLTNLELIDPYRGFAALHLTAPSGAAAPYHIEAQGSIGGGASHGEGIRIDAGRASRFQMFSINTEGANVILGPGVNHIVLDGGGQERCWTYKIHPTANAAVLTPVYARLALPDQTHRSFESEVAPRAGCD